MPIVKGWEHSQPTGAFTLPTGKPGIREEGVIMPTKPVKKKPEPHSTFPRTVPTSESLEPVVDPPSEQPKKPVEKVNLGPDLTEPNWADIDREAALLSPKGLDGERARMDPDKIIAQAQYLAELYRQYGKPIPGGLAVLI